MNLNEIKTILKDLIPELNKLTIQYMTQAGVESKSNLTQSVGFEITDNGLGLMANNYWYYASQGRRPNTKKVPITALIDYIKRYNISPKSGQSINQLAFAIQTSIYKQGINPKNYVDKVIDATSDLTEEVVADDVIELLADEIMGVMLESPYATEV